MHADFLLGLTGSHRQADTLVHITLLKWLLDPEDTDTNPVLESQEWIVSTTALSTMRFKILSSSRRFRSLIASYLKASVDTNIFRTPLSMMSRSSKRLFGSGQALSIFSNGVYVMAVYLSLLTYRCANAGQKGLGAHREISFDPALRAPGSMAM